MYLLCIFVSPTESSALLPTLGHPLALVQDSSGTLPSATLCGSLWLKAWPILLLAPSLTSLECSLQDITEEGGMARPSMATVLSHSLSMLWLTYSPLASLVAILKPSVILSPNP